MKKLIQRIRTLGMDLSISALNWVDEQILNCNEWDEALGLWCWLDDRLHSLFGFFYAGSDEELHAVDNDEIPPAYMSERQMEYLRSFDLSDELAHCTDCACFWEGTLEEALECGGWCPECDEAVSVGALGFTPKRREPLLLMERSLA